MKAWVALLRSVNVGGTGKLAMGDLRDMCAACGFAKVRTYIASGNVVLASTLDEAAIKRALEERLTAYAGRHIAVLVRDAAEMAAVLAANPFPDADPSRSLVIFLDEAPAPDTVAQATGQSDERIALGKREIHVDYPHGVAASRLSLAASRIGTARNMNTVTKMAQLAAALEMELQA